MKKTLVWTIMMVFLVLMSCSGNGEVKQFVADFAEKVTQGDMAALEQMYPEISKADSLSAEFNPDSVVIEKAEGESDIYTVRLCRGKEIVLHKGEDGKLFVYSSRGLFAYPEDMMKLALGTGWFDRKLTDAENAARLSDTSFVPSLQEKAQLQFMDNITVTKTDSKCSSDWTHVTCTVEVTNGTGRTVPGDAYFVQADLYGYFSANMGMFADYVFDSTRNLTGQAIPAHGSTVYTFQAPSPGWPGDDGEVRCKLMFKITPEQMIDYYVPTGTEYQEYLENNN